MQETQIITRDFKVFMDTLLFSSFDCVYMRYDGTILGLHIGTHNTKSIMYAYVPEACSCFSHL